MTEEQAEALRPRRSTSERPNYDTLRPLLEQVADKSKEASGRLWTRILNRLRA